MTTKTILTKIGLKEQEINVYLDCLGNIKSTPSSIEKNTGIARPTVYKILDSLLDKQLLHKESSGGRTFYFSNDPSASISSLIKKREAEVSDIKESSLKLIKNLDKINQYRGSNTQGQMKVYDGLSGMSELFAEVLKRNEDIRWFGSSQVLESAMEENGKYLRRNFSFKKIDRELKDYGIVTDVIPETIYYSPDIPSNGEYKKVSGSEELNCQMAVVGDIFGVIKKNGKDFKLYTIRDKDISELFKALLKDYWKRI